MQETEQLSLEVGGDRQTPALASFRIGGKISVDRELYKGDDVIVTVADADGVVVAIGRGFVKGVGFVQHRPKEAPEWTERTHSIKLEAEQ